MECTDLYDPFNGPLPYQPDNIYDNAKYQGLKVIKIKFNDLLFKGTLRYVQSCFD